MKKILTAFALAACATLASAGALTLTGFEHGPTPQVNVVSPMHVGSVYAGGLDASFNDGTLTDLFTVYCIELNVDAPSFNHSKTYTMNTPALSAAAGNPFFDPDTELRLEKLFDRNNGATNLTATGSAAMQLAIWEILYDGGASFGNVTTGNFKVDHISNGVRDAANALLDNLDAEVIDLVWDLTSFNSGAYSQSHEHDSDHNSPKWDPKYQDFLTATSTGIPYGACIGCPTDLPEPGSLALAGMGLLGAGIIQRRRKMVVVTK
jgi:hypothetical protein